MTKTIEIMTTIITKENLYNSKVVNVDLNNVKNVTETSFYANIEIEFLDGSKKEFDGEFGYFEFQKDFGFSFCIS